MDQACSTLGEGKLTAERLTAANINPRTGLATDYLNHFNEVVMLLEMLPDMPECAEDVLEWQPLSYEAHFEASNFAEKHLAIEAFRAAPVPVRRALRDVVATLDTAVCEKQGRLRSAEDVRLIAEQVAHETVEEVRPLIASASAIIHGEAIPDGTEDTEAQDAIDALFA
ncbi:hypothetical protein [Stappia indica]|uniref:hypothetical protein n=1 Tax=Stappia indica TaxID=538381 RepID=UPI00384E1BC3